MQLCFKFYYALLYKIKNSNPYIAPFMINLMYQKTKELRKYTHKQCFCATRQNHDKLLFALLLHCFFSVASSYILCE